MTVFAGDIPYALLSEDNAKLYIGEIIEYDRNTKTATIQPIMKIKGDVDLEVSKTINIWENNAIQAEENHKTPTFWIAGGKPFNENEQCLVLDFGSNYDNSIFHISGDNLRTLKIEDIDPNNMWGALQTLLNEGKYEEAENARLEKLNRPAFVASENLPPVKKTDAPMSAHIKLWLIIGMVIVGCLAVLLLILRRKKHMK